MQRSEPHVQFSPTTKEWKYTFGHTGRGTIADLANANLDLLTQDPEIESEILRDKNSVVKYFDQLIEINLSRLEPYMVGPHTPDLGRPISKMAADVREHSDYVDKISVALIGNAPTHRMRICLERRDIAEQAKAKGLEQRYPYKLRQVPN